MRRDPAVFLMGEDIAGAPPFGVTTGLAADFGTERVRDTPCSEVAVVGAAVGAAIGGMRPIVEFQFGDFLSVAIDQLTHQAAMLRYLTGGQVKVPLVIRLPCGGGQGAGSQHSQALYSWFAHVPGIKVALPATSGDAKGLMLSAIRDDNPVLFFEHKLLYGSKGREQAGGLDLIVEVPEEEYLVPLGRAVVKRVGTDVTVVATHVSLYRCLAVAEELATGNGIECEVIDPLTLLPLDTETIWASLRKTGRLVIVHEDTLTGGWGAEVAARAADECLYHLEAPIKRVAAHDVPVPYAPVLEQAVVPGTERIRAAILEVCG